MTGLHTSHNIPYPGTGTGLHTSHNIYPGNGLHTSHNIYPWNWSSHKSQHIPLELVFTQVTTYHTQGLFFTQVTTYHTQGLGLVFTQVTTYTPGIGLHTSHNISYPGIGTGLYTSHNIYPWDWSSHKSQHIPRDSSSHKSQHIIPRDWDWSLHKSQHIPLGLVFTQVTTYTPGTGIHTSHNIYPRDWYSHKSQHMKQHPTTQKSV